MSSESESQQPVVVEIEKRTRGRPKLTDEQRLERDRRRYERQHEYYLANKERISEHQREIKNEKYKNDPEFRQKAIDYITAYNKRRTAICRFVEAWPDKEFQKQLMRYLAEKL